MDGELQPLNIYYTLRFAPGERNLQNSGSLHTGFSAVDKQAFLKYDTFGSSCCYSQCYATKNSRLI